MTRPVAWMILLAGLLAVAPLAAQQAGDAPRQPAGDAPQVRLNVRDVPLQVALGQLAEQAGLELELRGELPERNVSVRLVRPVALPVLLTILQRQTGLRIAVEGKRLVVESAGEMQKIPDRVVPEADGVKVPEALVQEAEERLRAVFDAPGDREALLELGYWLRGQRPDWAGALPASLVATWQSWDESPAGALRGARVFEQLGHAQAAARLAGMAVRDAALKGEATVLLARIELQEGDANQALAQARRALDEDPENAAAAALVAQAMFYQGREQEALAEAMTSQARWPEHPDVLATLGDLLRRSPDSAGQAARVLYDALDADPGHADALYALAVLANSEGADSRSAWLDFLAAEPFSVRADRVRAGGAATNVVTVTERGGRVWAFSPDGERVLYTDQFRKQLQITDAAGFALANQVTDQEQDKDWADFSPDEEWLAWVVVRDTRQPAVYVQSVHASGQHQAIAQFEPGTLLRRATWSPDGRFLLFTEFGQRMQSAKLHAWDRESGEPVDPPAPLAGIDGLGDVAWAGDAVVGTLTRGERQAVVAVGDGGLDTLLPPRAAGSYGAPSLHPDGSRVLAAQTRPDALMLAAADGAEGGGVPLLTPAAGRGVDYALWSPDGRHVAVALSGRFPAVMTLDGLHPDHRLRTRIDPPLAVGDRAPKYTFRVDALDARPHTGELIAELIDAGGAAVWSRAAKLAVAPDAPAEVEVSPETTEVGEHWLRVRLTLDDVADAPRWYRFTIAP